MHFLAYILVSFLICVGANRIGPIDHNYINTFDTNLDNVNYRLPNNTKPLEYDIQLETYLEKKDNFTFNGTVTITFKVVEKGTKEITIHARQLTITGTPKLILGGANFELEQYKYDKTTEFLTFPLKDNSLLENGVYTLTLSYTGELRTDMGGFYRSSYVNENNEKVWLATTQFEQTEARHAFPCYDEPALKANFTISITHHKNYTAISNTLATKSEPVGEGRVKTSFDTTPKMSSYLVAFLISDYKSIENNTKENPTPQRVYAPTNLIGQANYSLGEGVALLNAIAKYLNVSYSLPKMDQVAIPDFRAGAMENWGLVTYRIPQLLFHPDNHTATRQLSVTTTISHEYGHQWFGNLVSPEWWSVIWLNEGFATLFEYLGTDLVHPSWDIWTYFVTNKLQPVLRIDSQLNTRPMTYYVESPSEVAKLFDNIAYAKAGAVIRMFMHAFGENTFKKGLKYYLTTNAYEAVGENALFASLNRAAQEDKVIPESLNVTDLFGSWSNQKGFPYIKVTRNANGIVSLQQKKYALTASNETDETWWIPYNFVTAQNPEFNETKPIFWMKQGEPEALINNTSSQLNFTNSDWIVLNVKQTGYYRILYDDMNYDLIHKELDTNLSKIDPINRAQIFDDINDFVLTDHLNAEHLCNAMQYLKKELAFAPWQAAKRAINTWTEHFQVSKKADKFKEIVKTLVTPYYESLTLTEKENEEILTKIARSTAVNLACENGVEQCLADTHAKLNEYIKGDKISQNIRGIAIANGIRSATSTEIESLWNKLSTNQTSSDERSEIISSLANIKEKSTFDIYLAKSVEVSNQTSQEERQKIIAAIAGGSQNGLSAAIDFVAQNLEKVQTNAGPVLPILKSMAEHVLTTGIQTKFNKLVDDAKGKGYLDDNDKASIAEKVGEKLNWQSNQLAKAEKDFFVGKCSSSTILAFPALILISIFFSRWNLF